MKYLKVLALLLCLTILLCACKGKNKPTETEAPTTEASETTLPTETLEILTTEAPTEPPEILEILQYGAFSGAYVEDGSDEAVENIACILVTNHSEGYIDYGVLHAQFGDTVGEFILTGIPAGGTAWVMESNRLSLSGDEDYSYVDQTISQIRTESMIDHRAEVTFSKGAIEVKNVSTETLPGVKVYYKQLHNDGNFLGGITYTLSTGELPAGQSTTLLSAHSTEGSCALVRLDCVEE